jgi:predicted metalloprotease
LPIGGGGIRIGAGGLILLVVVGLLFGINPLDILTGGGALPPEVSTQQVPSQPGPGSAASPPERAAPKDKQTDFVHATLAMTEDVWESVFRSYVGQPYQRPRLVLFEGQVASACGGASAAVGPFYCPADQRLYLDMSFFQQLSQRFRAPGDFAQAYVIAHEVGHHVQNLLGTMREVDRAGARGGGRASALAIRLELQADCYAGVFGYYIRDRLDPGDLEEGLRAAAAVGDDEIQKRTQGYVRPETFTHGSAEQRMRWFRRGMESGDPRRCDTFSGQV